MLTVCWPGAGLQQGVSSGRQERKNIDVGRGAQCGACTLQDFDVEPFGLSLWEAVMVDPQQRLLLEATASLLPAAAAALPSLAAAVGVFVGISNPDYSNIKTAATPIGVYSATGNPTLDLYCLIMSNHLVVTISTSCWSFFTNGTAEMTVQSGTCGIPRCMV
jgi:hypothetical protein